MIIKELVFEVMKQLKDFNICFVEFEIITEHSNIKFTVLNDDYKPGKSLELKTCGHEPMVKNENV
jgi:hypothetical protein